jgi:hypothetical protein
MNYYDKILKEKEESLRKITEYIIEGIKDGELKVTGKPIGLEILTVFVTDIKEQYNLLQIWTANRDEELSNMRTYEDSTHFPDIAKRKELMGLIIKNLSA